MKNFLENKARIFLILILLLGTFFRFWNLNRVPPSTSIDEASIGYNAYSVLKIGKDEFGRFPLIYQRGYDDWRRSTYLFLTIPFIKLLGLNVLAIRLPAAILSVLTLWAAYELTLSLFSKKSKLAINLALLATFLLAINPWHIYISRLGHESNACLTFFVFGTLFFLQGLKNKSKLFLSILFFTLSMISYYVGQVLVPPFILGLLIIFRKDLLTIIKEDRKILFGFIICLILIIPVLLSIFSPQAIIRYHGTNTFSPNAHADLFYERVLKSNQAAKNHNLFGKIIYNRRLFPLIIFWQNYISHFNPKWLFTNIANDSFKAPDVGLLYSWELPLIFIGILAFIFSKNLNLKIKGLIFLWFLLAPVPGSIATQAPHAMRTYNFLPTWQIFSAFGAIYLINKFNKFKLLILVLLISLAVLNMENFYNNYFFTFPQQQSNSFHYALSHAIPYLLDKQANYQKIIFSNTNNLYQSYMVFLYYSKFDPTLYQKLGGTKSGGYAEKHYFDKYEFRPIVWEKDKLISNALLIGNENDFPKIISGKIFSDIDGGGKIKIVKNQLLFQISK